MPRSKKEEYERLRGLINQWNVDHYDIFELSQPNDDLEFHGVVRFFFQGAEGANVVTKCIRVASTATTREVIGVLIEKFRPDMRMLGQNKYALYEVHVNGEERRLENEERPLYVQLNWGKDVREGRFLLRNEDHATVRDPALGFDKSVLQQDQPGFKRKLSKREKKEKKKREKEKGKENAGGATSPGNEEGVASKLYEEAPETSFTRSISNPEAVMRRRRQQKLEKKLAQMNTAEGGTDSGGTLKIYGGSLCPDVPYKTLFLSTADPAVAVVREAMEKYGLEKEDPAAYCLVEVLLPPGGMEYHGGAGGCDERVLHDNDCPLAIVMQHAKQRGQGHLIFQLRHRAADYEKRSKRQRAVSQDDLRNHKSDQRHTNVDMLPYLQELNVRGKPRRHVLPLNVTEVVNEAVNNRQDYNGKHFLQLSGPDIRPRHCVIAHTEGVVTVTPNNQDAETYVEGQRIYETTMLKHGMTVQFGKERLYHFLDPRFDEHPMQTKQPYQMQAGHGHPQETNFDIDGHVETVGGNSPRPGTQGWDSMQRRNDRSPGSSQVGPIHEDLLPASVELYPQAEGHLLQASILDVNSKQLQFKLAPTYTLYMAVRNLLTQRPPHQQQAVAEFVSNMASMAQQTIQNQHNDPPSLAFWMANCSEILHMLKQDRDLQAVSSMAQEMLAEAVQTAFHHLVRCSQGDLQRVMPAFLDPSDAGEGEDDMGQRYTMGRPTLADVLNTLSAAMTLLRRCRVNAALTIQLFSQLFHFINMWLFNILVTEPQLQLCTRQWGLRLKRRLGSVEAWAEKQGLELAADCHLCRIIQAAHLLQAPKSSADDVTNISSTCFKLNSMQLRALLTRYIPEPDEPGVSAAFVERVVSIAENMADELTRTDGREVRLEEDNDLHLPFLLPEDGYSCDTIRGIPNGLPEFARQLESANLCRFLINNHASGSWTVYMGDDLEGKNSAPASPGSSLPPNPEIFELAFNKVKGSMGLSIVAATGEGQAEQGVYIKSVVEGGAAALDGRLQAGDQLLEVDGKSLIGLTQDKAAELMTKTGQVVRLKVAKSAVLYHNLGSLLSQPSPTSQRAAMNKGMPPNRGFNDDGGPPPYDGRDTKPMNGYGDPDRRLNEPYSRRDIGDSRSKSTSNLHVETNLDRGDMQQPHQGNGQMRPAQSVSGLHPSSPGYGQYSPGGQRMDMRQNDYENQPRYPGTGDRNSYEGSAGPGNNKQGYNFVDPRQNLPREGKPQYQQQQQHLMPRQTSERSSVSSRASSGSNRDGHQRPQSAYYDPQGMGRDINTSSQQGEPSWSRPRSEDVGSKLKEWQDKYEDPQRQPPKQNNDIRMGGGGNNSPPYSNIGAHSRDVPPQPQYNPPPKPTAHERLFSNSSSQPPQQHQNLPQQQFQHGPQKVSIAPPHQRQPNFYENTSPLTQQPAPAFHQLPQAPYPTDSESRPRPAPKPGPIPAVKRGQPRVQHTEMPVVRMDGRSSQPQFYGDPPRSMAHTVQQPNFSNAGPNPPQNMAHQQQPQDQRHDTRNGPYHPASPHQSEYRGMTSVDGRDVPDLRHAPDPRNISNNDPGMRGGGNYHHPQQTEVRNMYPQQQQQQQQRFQQPGYYPDQQQQYNYHNNDLPPPPPVHNDLPPSHQEEELPPLPPPPSTEALLEQRLADEQAKLMQQINATNQFLATENRPKRYSPNSQQQQQSYQPPPAQSQQRYQQPQQQQQQSRPLNRVLPPESNESMMGYQVAQDGYQSRPNNDQHNYQNISFAADVRANSGPTSQAPPVPQPPSDYESYSNPSLRAQGFGMKPAVPANKPRLRDRPDANRSAWDRDAKEKAEEEEQEELFRAREEEINDLESRPYLSPGDQDRLRKLKMEHEFQRRVKEIAEKGDYEYDDDDELAERLFTRERLIATLKEDLDKSRAKHKDLEIAQQRAEAAREQERLQMLERRLEMYEKDREEQRQRMQRKQDKRTREHQEQLRQQRESREKQRQNYEEQKRQLMREEEKLNQRREEELNKRRQFERERRQELQDKRDAEEKRARAEVRAEEEEYHQQQLALERQQRAEQDRPIRVGEERRRIDSMNTPGGSAGQMSPSAQYANVGHDIGGGPQAPPPPQRNSSYEMFSHHQQRGSFRGSTNGDFPPPPPSLQQQLPPSAMKNAGEPPQPAKKSVSFNTQMNTYKDRTPSHSVSSYQSPQGSQSSDPGLLPPPLHSLGSPETDVFDQGFPPPPSPPQPSNNNNGPSTPPANQSYNTSSNTPNVIGAQEIYRDPRSKIEAKLATGRSSTTATDRMSFREKMKYFAQEAGEDTIKYKPKASKTLRSIESQLNGQ